MSEFDRVVRQLRLDHLAIVASGALSRDRVPHALIKGATTSQWLYDPPRDYRDVDMLVPASRLDAAVALLVDAGVVTPVHGRLGEEGGHSLVLVSAMGAELDLHVALPSLTPEPGSDALWEALEPHVQPFDIDGRAVPALDLTARCVVLALHVVASGQHSAQVREDFRRARQAVGAGGWAAAHDLAVRLGVSAHFDGAEALVDGLPLDAVPAEVRLRLSGGSASAIQIARLRTLPLHRVPGALWREAFPSRAFLARMFPAVASGDMSVTKARAVRLARLLRSVPHALAEVRSARGGERRQPPASTR